MASCNSQHDNNSISQYVPLPTATPYTKKASTKLRLPHWSMEGKHSSSKGKPPRRWRYPLRRSSSSMLLLPTMLQDPRQGPQHRQYDESNADVCPVPIVVQRRDPYELNQRPLDVPVQYVRRTLHRLHHHGHHVTRYPSHLTDRGTQWHLP